MEFKAYYLHGACDAGSRLMFKLRSGTHGLNEELYRREEGSSCIIEAGYVYQQPVTHTSKIEKKYIPALYNNCGFWDFVTI